VGARQGRQAAVAVAAQELGDPEQTQVRERERGVLVGREESSHARGPVAGTIGETSALERLRDVTSRLPDSLVHERETTPEPDPA
jgi:hypothetical protein